MPISIIISSSNLIKFEEIKKKNSLIQCGLDPYLPVYPSIYDLILKLVNLNFILTLDRVFSTSIRFQFVTLPLQQLLSYCPLLHTLPSASSLSLSHPSDSSLTQLPRQLSPSLMNSLPYSTFFSCIFRLILFQLLFFCSPPLLLDLTILLDFPLSFIFFSLNFANSFPKKSLSLSQFPSSSLNLSLTCKCPLFCVFFCQSFQ